MRSLLILCCAGLLFLGAPLQAEQQWLSHPPMRPLPVASQRPLPEGKVYHVHPTRGSDEADGSEAKPWRTVQHAVNRLQPGDTLALRGGTYYERVDVPCSGSGEKPITIRSYPGELAIIDGGLREFFESPATCWEPLEGGARDEYVSTKRFPQFARRPAVHAFPANGWEPFYGIENDRPVVLGFFGDSMIPLHGYRTVNDLRDDSLIWDVENKFDTTGGVYCGPGLWYNRGTQRIHIRLAHTNLAGLGDRNYSGETDPRKLPLCLSAPPGEDVLRLNGVKHLALQDLVLRGAAGSPLLNIYGAEGITLEGLTLYGGAPGLMVNATSQLKLQHCAVRSLAAPWSSRSSMKYRGTPSYAILTQMATPLNHDFEWSFCEFTDGHDFAWLRYVNNLRFHHNYVDNFNDDGLESGARKRDHEIYIHENLISRCLLTFSLHEMDKDESPATVTPGSGVYITRNVIDLRQGLFNAPRVPNPTEADLYQDATLCGDHGSPTWPNYFFYHNTVLRTTPSWRGYYAFGMGPQGTTGNTRRVFNNIFVQAQGIPGIVYLQGFGNDIQVDGNLYWGIQDGPTFRGDFFKKNPRVPLPEEWMRHDQFADPQFTQLGIEPGEPFDLTLKPGSPAIDKGVPIPSDWIDPLRIGDAGEPDIGAFPAGAKIWPVGIQGRLKVCGPGALQPGPDTE